MIMRFLALAVVGGCYQATTAPAPANAEHVPAVPPPALAPAPPPPSDVLATQVDRGATLYAIYCSQCHGEHGEGDSKTPPVIGKAAFPLDARTGYNRDIKFHTAADVFWWATKEMPGDDPGSLKLEEYLAIFAFDLTANGIKLERPLDAVTAQQIVLHP